MHILFLCTGNSCRSQMAEGFARALGAEGVTVASAGLAAHGRNPRAIAAMAEVRIDIAGQSSTVLTRAMIEEADLVVTVCGDADKHCPVLPPRAQKLHWPVADPARARGSEEEIEAEFRRVRDDMHERVRALLAERGVLRDPARPSDRADPTPSEAP